MVTMREWIKWTVNNEEREWAKKLAIERKNNSPNPKFQSDDAIRDGMSGYIGERKLDLLLWEYGVKHRANLGYNKDGSGDKFDIVVYLKKEGDSLPGSELLDSKTGLMKEKDNLEDVERYWNHFIAEQQGSKIVNNYVYSILDSSMEFGWTIGWIDRKNALDFPVKEKGRMINPAHVVPLTELKGISELIEKYTGKKIILNKQNGQASLFDF